MPHRPATRPSKEGTRAPAPCPLFRLLGLLCLVALLGLPVPGAVVIPAEAFEAFLEQNDLLNPARELMRKPDPSRGELLRRVGECRLQADDIHFLGRQLCKVRLQHRQRRQLIDLRLRMGICHPPRRIAKGPVEVKRCPNR